MTAYEYDAMDRLVRVVDPAGNAITISFDAQGNRTEVSDNNGNISRFTYDAMNRMITETDPLGRSIHYFYDSNGNLLSRVDRKEQLTTFAYDAVNQRTSKLLPGGQLTQFEYDDVGNVTSVVDLDSALTFTYDLADRLTSASTTESASQPNITLSYTYDNLDNRTSMTNSTGTTTYEYDDLNRLKTLRNSDGQTITFEYDALSRRTELVLPNGATTSYEYDPVGRLLGLAHQLAASDNPFSAFTYTYDALGNREILDQVRSAIAVKSPLAYVYDDVDQLVRATHSTRASDETFQYDAAGNRLLKDSQEDPAQFDATNRLLEDENVCFGYDPNGNLLSKEAKVGDVCTGSGDLTEYDYDAEDQLISVRRNGVVIASFRYDGLGRRIEKVTEGRTRRYIYDGNNIDLEFDDSNRLEAHYLYTLNVDEPLMMARDLNDDGVFQEGERFLYHVDGLGSVTEITDSVGVVVRAYVYDSFGTISRQSGSLDNPYTYSGRELDPETNLAYPLDAHTH